MKPRQRLNPLISLLSPVPTLDESPKTKSSLVSLSYHRRSQRLPATAHTLPRAHIL